MSNQVDFLIEKIRDLEKELEWELAKRAEELRVRIFEGKIEYTEEIRTAHQALKSSLVNYVFKSNPLKLLTLPFIYGLAVPFGLLDATVSVYQAICFPVYQIPKVKRADYLVFDRASLEYLNLIEKLHCAYCSYVNGLIGYVREIAARTEQYWCPIKHAKRIKATHSRYSHFVDYGDAESYRDNLGKLRKKFDDGGKP